MPDEISVAGRRNALKCLAWAGAGTLFVLAGGVMTPIDFDLAAADPKSLRIKAGCSSGVAPGRPLRAAGLCQRRTFRVR